MVSVILSPEIPLASRIIRKVLLPPEARKNFGNDRLRRRDRFCPKIVQVRALLAVFWLFEIFAERPTVALTAPVLPLTCLRPTLDWPASGIGDSNTQKQYFSEPALIGLVPVLVHVS